MDSVRRKEIINLVMRQTDYNEEQVIDKLKQWNNNYINVIKEYLNPNFNKTVKKEKPKTLNQQMMGEIRNFMDDVYIKFENRKRYNEYINTVQQIRQQQLNKNKKTETNKDNEIDKDIKVNEKNTTESSNEIKIEEV